MAAGIGWVHWKKLLDLEVKLAAKKWCQIMLPAHVFFHLNAPFRFYDHQKIQVKMQTLMIYCSHFGCMCELAGDLTVLRMKINRLTASTNSSRTRTLNDGPWIVEMICPIYVLLVQLLLKTGKKHKESTFSSSKFWSQKTPITMSTMSNDRSTTSTKPIANIIR